MCVCVVDFIRNNYKFLFKILCNLNVVLEEGGGWFETFDFRRFGIDFWFVYFTPRWNSLLVGVLSDFFHLEFDNWQKADVGIA